MKCVFAAALFASLVHPVWADSPILAKNEWTTVTKADFDAEITRIPKDQQFGVLASAERVSKLVENVLVNKTLAAQARAMKIDQDPVVRAEMENQLEKVLARNRMERLEIDTKVPDLSKRAEEVYKADPKKYAERPVYDTSHILVDTKCRTRDAAFARAREALAEVRAGKPFAEIARKFSDDPSVQRNNGNLGPLTVDGLAGEYVEVMTSLKPGEVGGPVATPYGVHIIKLESLKPGRQYRFEEVRESILTDLRADYSRSQRQAHIDRIKGDPKLEMNIPAIEALKTNINAPAGKKQPG
jgi:peptidyl-prolyl cis-trans isomerase C